MKKKKDRKNTKRIVGIICDITAVATILENIMDAETVKFNQDLQDKIDAAFCALSGCSIKAFLLLQDPETNEKKIENSDCQNFDSAESQNWHGL
jgi:hypothetical protein